jgi:hypothetical protein
MGDQREDFPREPGAAYQKILLAQGFGGDQLADCLLTLKINLN